MRGHCCPRCPVGGSPVLPALEGSRPSRPRGGRTARTSAGASRHAA
nr:hypothetical protein RVX_2876 [Nitratidesulfovibrio sp. HK-II]